MLAPGNQNSSTRSRFYAILLSNVENMHFHEASFLGVQLGKPSQEKIDVDCATHSKMTYWIVLNLNIQFPVRVRSGFIIHSKDSSKQTRVACT